MRHMLSLCEIMQTIPCQSCWHKLVNMLLIGWNLRFDSGSGRCIPTSNTVEFNLYLILATLRSGYMLQDTVEFAESIEKMMRQNLGIPADAAVSYYISNPSVIPTRALVLGL